MKNRKLLSLIILLCVTGLHCISVFGAVVGENKQWHFLMWDDIYVTDDWTDDDLTIIGNDDGTTRVSDGTLYLSGNGSTNRSCIKFRVKGTCLLRVRLCSNNTSFGANVAISDGTKVLGELQTPTKSNAKVMNFEYIGPETDLYIYSKNRNVLVYIVAVDFTKIVMGDVTGDGLVKEDDAALIIKYISDSTVIGDKLKYADFDLDGTVDIKDVIKILEYIEDSKYSAELITVDTSDGTEVSTYQELTSALQKANAKVYVTDDIEVGDRIRLQKGGQSIIGVPKADGTLPVLDYADMKGVRDIINESSTDGDAGITIDSDNNTIANLVIENAHDNGILIKSNNGSITGNTVRNCILRYNNDSGLQITQGSNNTTVENVISYRNCDVYTRGSNADGFAVKLGAGIANTTSVSDIKNNANTFTNCYAWDNGDDGWDSYDKWGQDYQTYNNIYKNCMCWNNGTPALHLGYTDYINGLELDEDLPFIKRIADTNPAGYEAFKTAYNNRTLCSAAATKEEYGAAADAVLNKKINTVDGELSVTELLNSSSWRGNPNGFKLGSAYTESVCTRSLTNCIAFDHEKKGFDKNNSSCSVSLKNCISFDNKINYQLDTMNITGFDTVYGWGGTSSDEMPENYSITIPANYESMERKIRKAAQMMVKYAKEDKIGKTGVFDQ